MARKTEAYARMVRQILNTAASEIAESVVSEGYTGDVWFSFDDYPKTKRLYDKLQREITDDMKHVVINGVTALWEDSNFKNDKFAKQLLGNRAKLAGYKRYFDNNEGALNSFLKRQKGGLNLSLKVWREEYKTNLEAALSAGMSTGKSADQLSREIRNYLNEPKKLYRRIKEFDDDGKFKKWKLSKEAQGYNPGAGQYRSSYKNAMRLTRTEINMAYRKADLERWTQFDFVVGYEVKRSMSGHFDCPMCSRLVDKYPKDFVFTGWHPQCMCYMVPILKTIKEMDRDYDRIMRGEDPLETSVNMVKNVPPSFDKWIDDNMTSIKKKKNKPYYFRDNKAFIRI